MLHFQLISNVLEWERRLVYEEERRKNHRSELYVNYLTAIHPFRKGLKGTFAWAFQHRKENQEPADFVKALNFYFPNL